MEITFIFFIRKNFIYFKGRIDFFFRELQQMVICYLENVRSLTVLSSLDDRIFYSTLAAPWPIHVAPGLVALEMARILNFVISD